MATIYLSYDPTAPARKAQTTALEVRQAAEVERAHTLFAEFMADKPSMSGDDSIVRNWLIEHFPRSGWSANPYHSFPYSIEWQALEVERAAVPYSQTVPTEQPCSICGKYHDQLWRISRAMADQCGHFPCFRINGAIEVVDGTLPTTISKLPRDSVKMTPEQNDRLWHGEGHYFGSMADPGLLLRTAPLSAVPQTEEGIQSIFAR